jgi:predicted  nucleic acid-binding Zn-ribbon protein
MTDKELVERLLDFDKVTVGDARDAALRIEALTAKVKLMDDLDVINGEKIEALTEQLEAARADAKEAEAYAEGLEKEIELNEQEACMLEDDFIKADKEIDALKAKLAAAVDWFETIRDRAKGDYMAHTYYLDALAALATIKRREP